MMRTTAALLCLSVALCSLVGLGNSAQSGQAKSFTNIPLVLPDPAYESPNDTDLVYREVVLWNGRKYWGWGSALGKSLSSYTTLQAALTEWDNKLRSAEKAFWQDYARDGQANAELRNEFAYWLHKRELWSSVVTSLNFAAKQSAFPEMAQVFTFILGNRRPNAFTLPIEIEQISTPTIEGPPKDYVGSHEYRAYFARLSQRSYLLNCPCSPRYSDDPLDKIAYMLLYPFGAGEAVDAKIAEIEAWAGGDQQKVDQLYRYLSEGQAKYRLSINLWAAVDGFMAGNDPIAEQAAGRFSAFLQMRQTFRHIKIDGPKGREGFIEIKNNKGFITDTIIIAPQTHDELKRCIERNWTTIVDFLFSINHEQALAIFESATMHTIQFQKDIGYIAIIGCSSPAGLADERIPALLKKHRLL